MRHLVQVLFVGDIRCSLFLCAEHPSLVLMDTRDACGDGRNGMSCRVGKLFFDRVLTMTRYVCSFVARLCSYVDCAHASAASKPFTCLTSSCPLPSNQVLSFASTNPNHSTVINPPSSRENTSSRQRVEIGRREFYIWMPQKQEAMTRPPVLCVSNGLSTIRSRLFNHARSKNPFLFHRVLVCTS